MLNRPLRWWPYLEETLLVCTLVVNLAVALSVRHFPYMDTTNHLARYVLMDRYWFGGVPDYVEVNFVPTGYVGMDLLGMTLVHFFSPQAALRVITILALVLLPTGMYLLLRETCPARRGWALVAVLFGFNWFLLVGFLNYVIGVGLSFLWLAWWWPRRERMSGTCRVLLTLGATGLFLVHMAAAATVLVVVCVEYLMGVLPSWMTGQERQKPVLQDPRLLTAVTVLLPIVCLWLWMKMGSPPDTAFPILMEFRTVHSKLIHLFTPFYSFSAMQGAVMASGYGVALVIILLAYRKDIRLETLGVSSFVFLVLYFIFPVSIFGAYDVDVRFLIPAFLLLFCIPAAMGGPWDRRLMYVLFLACLLHAGVVEANLRQIDRELADFDRLLEQIPARTRVLTLICDRERHGRVDPYRHFAHWHTINRKGRVPHLFAGSGSAPHLRHFRVTPQLYQPHTKWGTRWFYPLDWSRIFADHDYIIQAGRDDRCAALIKEHVQKRARAGDLVLYEVVRPGSLES